MNKLTKLILTILAGNFLILNIFYAFTATGSIQDLKTKTVQALHTKDTQGQDNIMISKEDSSYTSSDDMDIVIERDNAQVELENPSIENDQATQTSLAEGRDNTSFDERSQDTNITEPFVLGDSNPLEILGAYMPEIGKEYFADSAFKRPRYEYTQYQLHHDSDYCMRVDKYNIEHPENMFDNVNFFTDFFYGTRLRNEVMAGVGKTMMPGIKMYRDTKWSDERKYHLDSRVTSFFVYDDTFYFHHKIGRDFLCATQIYNRIPGHDLMVRKDRSLDGFKAYADSYIGRPQCFSKGIFPTSYRLYVTEECQTFFDILNSPAYQESLETEPLQYLIKLGHNSHRAEGVFLMDDKKGNNLNQVYEQGNACGRYGNSLIIQQYISNPLLLDMNNKFDFRIYMLIASTNPLMVYYHDGFLRVALSSYDKSSKEKGTHLTNTHLAQEKFEEAKTNKVNGMTEEELQEYHLWNFDKFSNYLLQTGKIKDPNWLDNYLRPSFHKATIHLVRMAKHKFWKGSNVYQIFGLDFMLDDQLNLWYIEGNPSPQLYQTTQKMSDFMVVMLKDMFEIQTSLYRSRMKRIMAVVKEMIQEEEEGRDVDLEKWQRAYTFAEMNSLEEEYKLSENNTWTLIMNENLRGADAYFGYISEECV